MKKVALILSGCGVYDGSEIHEVVLMLYFLEKNGCSIDFYAPNIVQAEVINHLTKEKSKEIRNVLVESARIARGDILDLSHFDPDLYEAVFFPGGFGAAKNLSNYATKHLDFSINDDIVNLIKNTHLAKKPIGFLCITPVIAAKLFPSARLTLGFSNDSQETIDNLGARGIQANFDDVVVDEMNLIASTPAYMLDASISEIAIGIEKIVKTVLALNEL